jgi:O-antigen/teichoic acid export membrane protein
MLKNLKYTLKHTAIYSFGNIIIKLAGLILLPIYTSELSLSDFGVFAFFEASSQFLVASLNMGFPTSLLRWCAEEKDIQRQKAIIFTLYIVLAILIVIFISILQPFTRFFSQQFFSSGSYDIYFLLMYGIVFFEVFNQLTLSLIRHLEKPVYYVVLTLIKFMVIIGANIMFIVHFNMGVKGILLGSLIGSALLQLITLPIIMRNIKFHFLARELKAIVRYGFPLVLSTVATMLLTLSDRYIIQHFLSFADLGRYSLGYKFAGVINVLILQSFQLGFLPIAFKMYDQPESRRFFSKIMTYVSLILVFAALCVSYFSKETIILFAKKNSDYWSAYLIVPLISFSFILKGIQYVLLLGLHYVKKTVHNAGIVFFSALLNIGLNFLLIPLIGIYGAAIASIVANTVMVFLYYHFSQRFFYVPYENVKIIKILAVGIVLYSVTLLFNNMNIYIAFFLKIFLLPVFLLLLYFIKTFEPIELVRLKEAWKKWRRISNLRENRSRINI